MTAGSGLSGQALGGSDERAETCSKTSAGNLLALEAGCAYAGSVDKIETLVVGDQSDPDALSG